MIELLNTDCMEYMKGLKDNAFELAIVDPPYGIGFDNKIRDKENLKRWDDCAPNDEYFSELIRTSKNQIVWGGNYFQMESLLGLHLIRQPSGFIGLGMG